MWTPLSPQTLQPWSLFKFETERPKFLYYSLRKQWENHPTNQTIKSEQNWERRISFDFFVLVWFECPLTFTYIKMALRKNGFLRTQDKNLVTAKGKKKKITPVRHFPKAPGPKHKLPKNILIYSKYIIDYWNVHISNWLWINLHRN